MNLLKVPIYVAARAGLEPATLRTKRDESTNEPPRPTKNLSRRIQFLAAVAVSSDNGCNLRIYAYTSMSKSFGALA